MAASINNLPTATRFWFRCGLTLIGVNRWGDKLHKIMSNVEMIHANKHASKLLTTRCKIYLSRLHFKCINQQKKTVSVTKSSRLNKFSCCLCGFYKLKILKRHWQNSRNTLCSNAALFHSSLPKADQKHSWQRTSFELNSNRLVEPPIRKHKSPWNSTLTL